MKSTGHSRSLRQQLKKRRLSMKMSQGELGVLIAEQIGKPRPYSAQAISYWENFERHPSIDAFAAWARILGHRLLVDLADDTSEAIPIRVEAGRVEHVREFGLLNNRDAGYVRQLLELLPLMDDRDRRMLQRDLEYIGQEIAARSSRTNAT